MRDSLPGPRGRLRGELSGFVGRRAELGRLRAALGEARLVTLTGPGGIGKTRLAVQAAAEVRRRFRDGAWMVELAGLGDPALLAQEVARAFGMLDQSSGWAVASLADSLAGRHALLVPQSRAAISCSTTRLSCDTCRKYSCAGRRYRGVGQ